MCRLLGVPKLACLCSGPTRPGSLQVGSVLDPRPQRIVHPTHRPFELRAVGPGPQRCHTGPTGQCPCGWPGPQSAAPSSVQGLAPEATSALGA